MANELTKTFDYRLTATTYRKRLQYDEGPGSYCYVVSDETGTRVIDSWRGRDENFGEHLIHDGYYPNHPRPDDDDFYEYSYRLERKLTSGSEWEYVGYVRLHHWDDEDNNPEWPDDPEPSEEEPLRYQYLCVSCGVEVPDGDDECAACVAKWEEMMRPRCLACSTTVEKDGMLCERCSECEKKYRRERWELFFEFLIFDKAWRRFCWSEFIFWLKGDVLQWLKKRMRR